MVGFKFLEMGSYDDDLKLIMSALSQNLLQSNLGLMVVTTYDQEPENTPHLP